MKKYWNGESKRNRGIASLTAFAHNDAKGVFACNGNFSQVNKEKKRKIKLLTNKN